MKLNCNSWKGGGEANTKKKLGREGVDIFQTDAWNKNKLKKLRMGLKSLPVIAAYLFLITIKCSY